MRKDGLETLILKGQLGEYRDRGKQELTYMPSLIKWMAEQSFAERTKSKICKELQWIQNSGETWSRTL